jgi:hypothetical protein
MAEGNIWKLRDHFVCNNCRAICSGQCWLELEKLQNGEDIEDKDLYPRKQLIGCLGQYCDKPCKLQKKESDLKIDHLINLSKYLGVKLNEFLMQPNI